MEFVSRCTKLEILVINMEYIFVFLAISLITSLRVKIITLFTIKEIYSPRFPKGYVEPSRLIKKIFKLKDKLIPRYLNFELYVSLFFAILGPINLVICTISGDNPTVTGVLVMIHVCLNIVDLMFFAIATFIFKRLK